MNSSVNINNKKAKYDYSLLDKYTCGIVLTGNEIKSIRNSKASLNNAYCEFEGDELFVVNMHIDLYDTIRNSFFTLFPYVFPPTYVPT